MDTSCAKRMELDVLRIFKYCKISGTVINLKALKNLKPAERKEKKMLIILVTASNNLTHNVTNNISQQVIKNVTHKMIKVTNNFFYNVTNNVIHDVTNNGIHNVTNNCS